MRLSALAVLAIPAFYVAFYTVVLARARPLAEPLIRRSGVLQAHPRRQVDAFAKLVLATACQTVFAVLLSLIARPPWSPGISAPPLIWCLAALLGAAELAVSSLLCSVAVKLHPRPLQLVAASAGGWMGQFRSGRQLVPGWVFALITLIYVSGEEVLFRAVVLTLLQPLGVAVAVTVSTLLFLLAQGAGMPSRDAATFPLIGATVVGVTHALLYWHTQALGPLAVAHAVFLLAAFTQVTQPVSAR